MLIFSSWCKRRFPFLVVGDISFSVLKNGLIQNYGLGKSSFSSGVFGCFIGCFRSILRIVKWVRDRKVAELHECLSLLLCLC